MCGSQARGIAPMWIYFKVSFVSELLYNVGYAFLLPGRRFWAANFLLMCAGGATARHGGPAPAAPLPAPLGAALPPLCLPLCLPLLAAAIWGPPWLAVAPPASNWRLPIGGFLFGDIIDEGVKVAVLARPYPGILVKGFARILGVGIGG